MKRIVESLLFVLLLCGIASGAVEIDFFYEPGCHDCERIEEEIFPEIGRRFGDACVITSHDIGIETNFITLLELENAMGHAGPDRGYLIVEKQYIFGPRPDVEELCSVISNVLIKVGQGSSLSAPDRPANGRQAGLDQRERGLVIARQHPEGATTLSYFWETDSNPIRNRFSGFTFSAVFIAGLLDGLNPCAISTLVFFMSLLAVSKVKSRQLLLLGASFCAASFVTYLALGFGLLRVLHLLDGFTALRSAVEWGMTAILLTLAVFSFRDAIRFRRSHDGHDVTLQLSTGMKKRIHHVMRRGLKTGHLVLGGLFIGAMVTALESVCTGQVYVPTLVLILKNNALAGSRAWVYLLTYNLLFILPLVLTFIAVYFGLRTETLLRWSRQHVVLSKLFLGIFFALMAFLIIGM